MTTGQRIKEARKQAGLTQMELAQKLNIPFQSVSQWERDVRNPKLETLQRIGDALSVSFWNLIPDPELGEEENLRIMEEILEDYPYQSKFGPLSGKDIDRAILIDIKNLYSSDDELYNAYLSGNFAVALQENKIVRRLCSAYGQLNAEGQQKAVERVEELTEISRYRRPESPPPSPADRDPPAGEKPAEGN